jgi:hypothetical protein
MSFLCPNCHSHRIYPSHGLFDWLLRMLGRNPYWCQLCSTRFYVRDVPLAES